MADHTLCECKECGNVYVSTPANRSRGCPACCALENGRKNNKELVKSFHELLYRMEDLEKRAPDLQKQKSFLAEILEEKRSRNLTYESQESRAEVQPDAFQCLRCKRPLLRQEIILRPIVADEVEFEAYCPHCEKIRKEGDEG